MPDLTEFGDWRSVDDDPPDWKDGPGQIELKRADGSIVSDRLSFDAWFNGEDEVPITELASGEDYWSFVQWRVPIRS